MAQRLRCQLRYQNGAQGFPCVLAVCKPVDEHLAVALSKPQLTITSYW